MSLNGCTKVIWITLKFYTQFLSPFQYLTKLFSCHFSLDVILAMGQDHPAIDSVLHHFSTEWRGIRPIPSYTPAFDPQFQVNHRLLRSTLRIKSWHIMSRHFADYYSSKSFKLTNCSSVRQLCFPSFFQFPPAPKFVKFVGHIPNERKTLAQYDQRTNKVTPTVTVAYKT